MVSGLLKLDPLAIRIDGLPVPPTIEAQGRKHPLGVLDGATENRAAVRARRIGLLERGFGRGCGSGAGACLRRRSGCGGVRGAGAVGQGIGPRIRTPD